VIAAIETTYKGRRFWSRIEARWAVFFDTLGVKYEYEKEGYRLPSGSYLPDFWLPEIRGGIWFEVKGAAATEREEHLAQELARAHGSDVVIASGDIPESSAEHAERGDGFSIFFVIDGEDGMDDCYNFMICGTCGKRGMEFTTYEGRVCHHNWKEYRTLSATSEDTLDRAYTDARSARFEHVERGPR
jgi:hypothetical protein